MEVIQAPVGKLVKLARHLQVSAMSKQLTAVQNTCHCPYCGNRYSPEDMRPVRRNRKACPSCYPKWVRGEREAIMRRILWTKNKRAAQQK